MSEYDNTHAVPPQEGAASTAFPSTSQVPPAPAAGLPPRWQPQASAEGLSRKSTARAAVLSLVPGLGQVYVGYYQQGFINIAIIGSVISILTMGLEGLAPLMVFFLVFYWLYNIIDASRKATIYNEALAGLRPMELPEDVAAQSASGSLAAGVGLILLGSLTLAHTLFDVPMEWIEDWWPLALVAIGAYLIWSGLSQRQPRS